MSNFRRYYLYRSILFVTLLFITLFFIQNFGEGLPLYLLTAVFILDELHLYFFRKEIKIYNVLVDATYIGLFMTFTGASISPFAPFYIPLIILSAYILKDIDSFIIAGYSGVLYGVITLLLPGKIPDRFLIIKLTSYPDVSTVLIDFVVYSLAFIFTSVISSIIVHRYRQQVSELRVTTSDIVEAVDQGILTVDKDGRILWSNSSASNFFKSKIRKNDTLDEILEDDYKEKVKELLNGIKDSIEIEIRENIYSITKSDIFNGEGTILVINDVTREKEEDRKAKMREKLVTLGHFAANLAHEVRNPVSTIRGSAELLKRKINGDEESSNLYNLIIRESDRLNVLVENFLEFAENLELNFEEINLNELISSIIENLEKDKYYNSKITIENKIPENQTIKADRHLLTSALTNLGTNSLKSIRGEGKITFGSITEGREEYLLVKDNGCGIPENEQDDIFSPFFSKFREGFGFGLPTVEKIVQLHGWNILINSKPGKGTEVRILL